MKCRDCGKVMNPIDLGKYAGYGFVPQVVGDTQEGICERCLRDRWNEGEDEDDLMAEFCG